MAVGPFSAQSDIAIRSLDPEVQCPVGPRFVRSLCHGGLPALVR